MNIFDEYIYVGPGSDYSDVGWEDLKKEPNCRYLFYVIDTKSSFLQKLHHIHFSFSLNKHIDLPCQSLWEKIYVLQPHDFEKGKQYCVIFTDISACRVNRGYLQKLYTLSNVTLVLLHANLVSTKKRLLVNRYKFFSAIFSFDKNDCETYNFIKYTTFYTKLTDVEPDPEPSDLFYVGVSKERRFETLLKLNEKLKPKNVKTNFYVAHFKGDTKIEPSFHYNQWLSYRDVLSKVLSTNCILEIVGEKQDGFTLRAIEALCYNKRLLTNNPAVLRLKYYNTGFIKYCKNFDDVDVSFITSDEPVDYHYQDDFAPKRFIDQINEVFSSKQ